MAGYGLTQAVQNFIGAREARINERRQQEADARAEEDRRYQMGLRPMEQRLNELRLNNAELQNKGLTQQFARDEARKNDATAVLNELTPAESTAMEAGPIQGLTATPSRTDQYQMRSEKAMSRGDDEYANTMDIARKAAEQEGFHDLYRYVTTGDPQARQRFESAGNLSFVSYDKDKGAVTLANRNGDQRPMSLNAVKTLAGVGGGKYKATDYGVMNEGTGSITPYTKEQLAGKVGSSKGAPAQIQTVEWIATNLTNGDKQAAWKMAQTAKSNPQELAVKMFLARKKEAADNFEDVSDEQIKNDVMTAIRAFQEDQTLNPMAAPKKGGLSLSPDNTQGAIGNMTGKINRSPVTGTDANLQRAIDAIRSGKDSRMVKQRLLDNGYTPRQLQDAGIY